MRHTCDMCTFLEHRNKIIINGSLSKEGNTAVHPEAIEINVLFSCASFACGKKVLLLENGFESAVLMGTKYYSGTLDILPVAFQNYNRIIKL